MDKTIPHISKIKPLINISANELLNNFPQFINIHTDESKSLNQRIFMEYMVNQIAQSNKDIKTIGFYDKKLALNQSRTLEHICKDHGKISYLLNSKLFPTILPQNRLFSTFNKLHITQALKYTLPQNIILSNPFKDIQTINYATSKRITNMVVSSMEQVYKIKDHDYSGNQINYLWQIQNPDLTEAKVLFPLLTEFGVQLNGLKFTYRNSNQINEIKKIIEIARNSHHNLKKIVIQIDYKEVQNIGNVKSSLNEKNMIFEISRMENIGFVCIAAKVLSRKARHIILYNEGQRLIKKEQEQKMLKKGIRSGDWISFEPKQILNVSNDVQNWVEMGEEKQIQRLKELKAYMI